MEILLSILIEWLALNTDIKVEEHPEVVFMAREELHKSYGSPVHALYMSSAKTVYLADDVRIETLEGASILLHELVHHYQNESGAMDGYSCVSESEKLAYEVQKQYLLANKAPVMAELSDFNIVMRSVCQTL